MKDYEKIIMDYNISVPKSFPYNKKEFKIANSILPWTESLDDSNINYWIDIYNALIQAINNETVHRKGNYFKTSFSISILKKEIVTKFDLFSNSKKLLISQLLREGYKVEGAKENIRIHCPSGQIRIVTKDSCTCKEFMSNSSKPCDHLSLANFFLENRSHFLNGSENQ